MFDAIAFAGGGNRCYWQGGFYEAVADRLGPLAERGVGVLALDSPGTGQSGVSPVVPGADRSLSRVLDVIAARPDVDPKRIALYGGSYGGYWATILAVTERSRLKAVVAQSPAIHESFARERTMNLVKNREYLFDYVPAQLFTYGAATIEELAERRERMSLKRQGMLDKPMAPMLVIGGALDTQVPLADVDLLLHSGETPKDAWIHPRGGHMQWGSPSELSGRHAQGRSHTSKTRRRTPKRVQNQASRAILRRKHHLKIA